MIEYRHLIGREFQHGAVDCFALVRDFYKDNYDIVIPNYARPDLWWKKGLNLYMDNFPREGFCLVDDRSYNVGDVMLSAILSSTPNHAMIYVGDGKIIHHRWNRCSSENVYRGALASGECARLRHPDVTSKIVREKVDVTELVKEVTTT